MSSASSRTSWSVLSVTLAMLGGCDTSSGTTADGSHRDAQGIDASGTDFDASSDGGADAERIDGTVANDATPASDRSAVDAVSPDSRSSDASSTDATSDAGPDRLDLRPYFPATGVPQTYRYWNETIYSTYTFADGNPSFQSLYTTFFDQRRPGHLITWQKDYGNPACTATYAQMWLADDLSVIEVGDWFPRPFADGGANSCIPNTVFGYHVNYETDAGVPATPSGLFWSPPGGLSATELAAPVEVAVISQNQPGRAYNDDGYDAWSQTVLVERFAQWTAPYGRSAAGVWGAGNGRTYDDVVHIILYHGTRAPVEMGQTRSVVRCTANVHYDPATPLGRLYKSYSDYQSYAVDLYLARGRGIVREASGFTEVAWTSSLTACVSGLYMGVTPAAQAEAERNWVQYIDDQSPR